MGHHRGRASQSTSFWDTFFFRPLHFRSVCLLAQLFETMLPKYPKYDCYITMKDKSLFINYFCHMQQSLILTPGFFKTGKLMYLSNPKFWGWNQCILKGTDQQNLQFDYLEKISSYFDSHHTALMGEFLMKCKAVKLWSGFQNKVKQHLFTSVVLEQTETRVTLSPK